MKRATGSSALALAVMAFLFLSPPARAADSPAEAISKAVHEQTEPEGQELVEIVGIITFVLLLCTAALGYFTAHGRKRLFKLHITSAVLTILSGVTHGTLVMVLL